MNSFRQSHLLDTQIVGLPFEQDVAYAHCYNEKITEYQRNFAGLSEISPIVTGLYFLFGVFLIIGSIYTILTTRSPAGLTGIIFGIDMMQAAVSGHSMFSLAFGAIAGLFWEQAYGELKPWEKVLAEYNIWSPCAGVNSFEARLMDAIWGICFSIAISTALGAVFRLALGKLEFFKEAIKIQAKAQLRNFALKRIKQGASMETIEWEIVTNPKLSAAWRTYMGTKLPFQMEINPFEMLPFEIGYQSIGLQELLNAIKQVIQNTARAETLQLKSLILSSLTPIQVSGVVRAFYTLKRLVLGFVNFGEWLPRSWQETLVRWLGPTIGVWWDNLLLSAVFGQNTVFLFRSIFLSITSGEPIGWNIGGEVTA